MTDKTTPDTTPPAGPVKKSDWLAVVAALLILCIAAILFLQMGEDKAPTPTPSPTPAQPDTPAQPPALPAVLMLEQATLRVRDARVDAGTIHVFVKNTTAAPVTIDEILMDEFSCTDLEDMTYGGFPAKRMKNNPLVVWATVFPPEIAPGRTADVRIRLRNKLRRERTLKIVPNGGAPVECKVSNKEQATLLFDDIAFSEDLREVFVYTTNRGTAAISEPAFAFDAPNGETPTPKHVWTTLAPNGKHVAIFTFAQALPRGEILNVSLTTKEKTRAQASVRIFSLAPISTWPHGGYAGDTRKEMHLDAAPFCVPYPKAGGDPNEPAPEVATDDSPNQGVYVYRNTTCRDQNFQLALGANANISWEREWDLFNHDRQRAAFLHICMYQKIRSCYTYGEVVDCSAFTPFEVTGFPIHGRRRYSGNPLRNAYYARAAKNGAAPNPAITNQLTGMLPQELQLSVWSQIGEGISGILYSGTTAMQPGTVRGAALARMNELLQQLKPYLRVGDPMPMDVEVPQNVRAYTLLGGDRGVVVIVINERFANRFPASKDWLEHTGESKPNAGLADLSMGSAHEHGGTGGGFAHLVNRLGTEADVGKDRAFRPYPRPRADIAFTVPGIIQAKTILDVTADNAPVEDATFTAQADGSTRVALPVRRLTTVKVYLLKNEK